MRPEDRRAADAWATDLVRLRAAAGVDVGEPGLLAARARRAVEVASAVGAPLLEALDAAAAAEEDARRAERAVAVASAQTRTVASGLLLAPVLLVPGLGRLVGADLLGFYRSPLGVVVGAMGIALLLLGALVVVALVRRVGRPPAVRTNGLRWSGVLAGGLLVWWIVHPVATLGLVAMLVIRGRRGRPAPAAPGVDEAADLTAIALAGGVAPGEALRVAAAELPDHAPALRRLALELELGLAESDTTGLHDPGIDRLRVVLTTASSVGAPAAPALRRLAHDLRADELARVLAAAERLPAQLTFPTALCLLPATLLLVGAPMVHAGLAAAAT
jgi:Flp pilus assembly protein TadB